MEKAYHQKCIGILLDKKLTFKHHTDNTLCKVNKNIAMIKKTKSICIENLYSLFTKYFWGL